MKMQKTGHCAGNGRPQRAAEAVLLPAEQRAAESKKKRRRRALRICLAAAAAVFALLIAGFGAKRGWWRSPFEGLENTMGGQEIAEDAPFTFRAMDVGQGDCTLILCDGQSMLIDAGENGKELQVLQTLASLRIGQLDYVVATHPHSDHIGGLPEVLDAHGAAHVILPRLTEAQTPTSETYRALLESIRDCGAEVIAARPNVAFSLGSATVTLLGPTEIETEDLNNMSVVLRVDYGRCAFLLTGDAETPAEQALLAAGAPLDCTVLKVGHHGSSAACCEAFLAAAKPEIAVIECGADNPYGHPHTALLRRLSQYTGQIYRTDLCGGIRIACDGERCSVTYETEES